MNHIFSFLLHVIKKADHLFISPHCVLKHDHKKLEALYIVFIERAEHPLIRIVLSLFPPRM